MTNPTFTRSLTALAHPLTVVAVLLLLANDHAFKALWPGWATGKLGDVVGLAFLPLLVAVPLSLVVGRWAGGDGRRVLVTAIGLSGAWWALAVTVPEVHAASLAVLSVLTASDFYWERDPWDIIALPGLWGAWYAWRASEPVAVWSRLRGVAVGALALVACVATSYAPPNPGVSCLETTTSGLRTTVRDVSLDGSTRWSPYVSQDGGLHWRLSDDGVLGATGTCTLPSTVSGHRSPDVRYRMQSGRHVEMSTDGAGTWRSVLDLSPLSREGRLVRVKREVWAERGYPGTPVMSPMPLDAALDAITGNLVLAMGHEGTLARTQDGAWHWAEVGPYKPRDGAWEPWQLVGEGSLAVVLTLLVLPLLGGRPLGLLGLCLMVLTAAGFAYSTLMLAVDQTRNLTQASMGLGSAYGMATLLAAQVLLAWPISQTWPGLHRAGHWLATALAAGCLYFAPFVLWYAAVIPAYPWALALSLALVASTIAMGRRANARWSNARAAGQSDAAHSTEAVES